MNNLLDLDSQLAALNQPVEPNLHKLLHGRIQDAQALELGDLTHFLVIEPGDAEGEIIDAIGFSPLVSRIDGVHLDPDWDWIERHEGWWELVYTVSNDGFAFILFVQDAPGVLPDLLNLCRGGWTADA
jgi:hypothetical protein